MWCAVWSSNVSQLDCDQPGPIAGTWGEEVIRSCCRPVSCQQTSVLCRMIREKNESFQGNVFLTAFGSTCLNFSWSALLRGVTRDWAAPGVSSLCKGWEESGSGSVCSPQQCVIPVVKYCLALESRGFLKLLLLVVRRRK